MTAFGPQKEIACSMLTQLTILTGLVLQQGSDRAVYKPQCSDGARGRINFG